MLPTLTLTPSYDHLDPPIRDLVCAINGLGIKTYWSCGGHISPSAIQSTVPKIILDHASADHKSFGTLIVAVGILNEDHLRELAWSFIPNNHAGNGSPFLSLAPRLFPYDEPSEILSRRQQEAKLLTQIIRDL